MIVEDGKMTVHITLNSKNIVQLFLGTAKDAQKDGADLIDPSGTETIEYTDGSEPKEVYTFDVPVKKLDEEFDLALIGTKGKWYEVTTLAPIRLAVLADFASSFVEFCTDRMNTVSSFVTILSVCSIHITSFTMTAS